jgi:hypothetical protein
MPEERYVGKGPAERIADREKPSNDMSTAYHHIQQGDGARRVHHTIHHPTKQHGAVKTGEKR